MSNARDEKAWEKIERDLRQSQSSKSLQQGGLPQEAVDRLTQLITDKRQPFTANLSVNEFLCTQSAGVTPVAQVSGSSVFHLGWQMTPWFGSGELAAMTEAQSTLRKLAVARIQQEARLVKADGVIGVKLADHEYDWGQGLLQFTLIGTAIKLPGISTNPHPFVSTLTGQEFWSLHEAGYLPVGFGYGNSCYYQCATSNSRYVLGEEPQFEWEGRGTGWFNQELEDFTEAINTARTFAEIRLQEDLLTLGASGIIDVKLRRKIKMHDRNPVVDHHRTDMSVSFEITGTAIALKRDGVVPHIDYQSWLA